MTQPLYDIFSSSCTKVTDGYRCMVMAGVHFRIGVGDYEKSVICRLCKRMIIMDEPLNALNEDEYKLCFSYKYIVSLSYVFSDGSSLLTMTIISPNLGYCFVFYVKLDISLF